MTIYTVTVAVEALTAANAARLVQRKVEGRNRDRTAAVLRVQDSEGTIRWRANPETKTAEPRWRAMRKAKP